MGLQGPKISRFSVSRTIVFLSLWGSSCEWGNSLTNLWNEREARRNEWENSLLVDVETQFVPWLLVVTKSHKLDRSLDPEPLLWRANRLNHKEAVQALQQQVNAVTSQNAALEAQLISPANTSHKVLQNCLEQSRPC